MATKLVSADNGRNRFIDEHVFGHFVEQLRRGGKKLNPLEGGRGSLSSIGPLL
jgi:hypothetical protein